MNQETATMRMVPTIDLKTVELPASVRNSRTLQNGIELFLQHGYLIIENAFDPAFIRVLHDEFTRRYKDYFSDRIFDDALDVGHRRTMVTIDLVGPFGSSDYYAPPRIFPLLEFLLTKKLIIAGLGCVVSLPGSKDQHVHRDYNNIYDAGFDYPGAEAVVAKGAPYAITLAIPLVPITELTGNTRFWPGTHLRRVPNNDPNLGPGVDFVAELGSCFLFDYRVLHSGVANRSDIVRPLLYNIYSRPWFRDPSNYAKQDPINISEEQFAKLPMKDQKLFAWAVANRAIKPRTLRRNEPCYCGSGLRFKNCHGRSAS